MKKMPPSIHNYRRKITVISRNIITIYLHIHFG